MIVRPKESPHHVGIESPHHVLSSTPSHHFEDWNDFKLIAESASHVLIVATNTVSWTPPDGETVSGGIFGNGANVIWSTFNGAQAGIWTPNSTEVTMTWPQYVNVSGVSNVFLGMLYAAVDGTNYSNAVGPALPWKWIKRSDPRRTWTADFAYTGANAVVKFFPGDLVYQGNKLYLMGLYDNRAVSLTGAITDTFSAVSPWTGPGNYGFAGTSGGITANYSGHDFYLGGGFGDWWVKDGGSDCLGVYTYDGIGSQGSVTVTPYTAPGYRSWGGGNNWTD